MAPDPPQSKAEPPLFLHTFSEGSEAVHCYCCDHECLLTIESCCFCKEDFDMVHRTTYPPRGTVAHRQYEGGEGGDESDSGLVFHRFGGLPAELRIKIWKHATQEALSVSRAVFLQPRILKDRDTEDDRASSQEYELEDNLSHLSCSPDDHFTRMIFKSDDNPVLAYVCHESRDILSESHSLVFGTATSSPTTWFNFKSDYLYFDLGWKYTPKYYPEDIHDLERVENLAMCIPRFQSNVTSYYRIVEKGMSAYACHQVFPFFKSLKKLSFVLKRHGPTETSGLVLDPKVWDLDLSMAFYTKPFDLFATDAFHDQRPHRGSFVPDERTLEDKWALVNHDPTRCLLEIFVGVITTEQKRRTRENAYNSWMLQRMAYRKPLKYRLLICPTSHGLRDETEILANIQKMVRVELDVTPDAPIFVISRYVHKIWAVADNVEISIVCRGFLMESRDIIGHSEQLTPLMREQDLISLDDHGSSWNNRFHVRFKYREGPVMVYPDVLESAYILPR